jgi:PAS domain S-box-containing protein
MHPQTRYSGTTDGRDADLPNQAVDSLFHAAPDGLVVIDASGAIIVVNDQTEKLFGYAHNELLGVPVEELLPESLREVHTHHRAEYLRDPSTRSMGVGLELYGVRKDASRFPVDINLSSLHAGPDTLVIASVRDVTGRKRAELLLEANRSELERSNLDLASFAYVASHDLQEPLRMVSSYVQLLADRYRGKLDPDADEFIRFAVDGVQRMQTLIRDLLDYSQVGTAELALVAIDTNELIADTLSSLELVINDTHAQITVGPLPTITADPTQLGQVFQNLISNALKFTAPGVVPRIRFSAARGGDNWRFSVEDNGIGIDAVYAERIFAPFKRLHGLGEYPGAGLGLSVCKRAVERLGGRIWVETAPDGGSTFSFTIPDALEGPDGTRQ